MYMNQIPSKPAKTTETISTSSLSSIQQPRRKLSSSSSSLNVATSLEQPSFPSSMNIQSSVHDSSTNNDKAEDDVNVGVLMLNLGGPEKTDDVEGFLYNLFADPDIIRLPKPLAPLQSLIALIISKRRAPKSIAAYESIGGGSPILKYSNQQAKLVQESIYDRYGLSVKTYIGMRYWYPFTEEALEQIQKDGINALVIIPLYPQFSISTSGSSLRVLQEEFTKNLQQWGDANKFTHTVVPQWYDRPGYALAMANLIQEQLDTFTSSELQEATDSNADIPTKHILFSAHGVPQSYIEAGDPYQRQIQKCVEGISNVLIPSDKSKNTDVQIHLSYQSRVGPIEWLRPYTDDVLPELGQKGVKNLVVVPISFVSEHIETLEEIDIEYRELAEESGVTNWRRCPALNTDETFITDMADMVMEALNEPSQSVTEACVANNVGTLEGLVDDKWDINSAGIQGVGANDGLMVSSKRGGGGAGDGGGFVDSVGNVGRGVLQDTEKLNGRLAILLVLGTVLLEILSGQPLIHWLGF